MATTLSFVQVDQPAACFDETTLDCLILMTPSYIVQVHAGQPCNMVWKLERGPKSMMLSLLLQLHRSGKLFLGI